MRIWKLCQRWTILITGEPSNSTTLIVKVEKETSTTKSLRIKVWNRRNLWNGLLNFCSNGKVTPVFFAALISLLSATISLSTKEQSRACWKIVEMNFGIFLFTSPKSPPYQGGEVRGTGVVKKLTEPLSSTGSGQALGKKKGSANRGEV